MSWLEDPLVVAFENATVDPKDFGHRAHVYVAWCYLKELTLEQALPRYVEHLQALTRKLGVPHKYHATVTWAYMVLLHELIREPEAAEMSFDALMLRYPKVLDPRAALGGHYDESELGSERARRYFVLPGVRRA